jgi:hypothetical protein
MHMQALPQQITDYIADRFVEYFSRKDNNRLNYREARTLIDYVAGPSAGGGGNLTADYMKPVISGGGGRRPSAAQVEAILQRYEVDDSDLIWDAVFDELITSYRRAKNKKALRIITLAFKKEFRREDICRVVHIAEKTFNNYRLAILTAAAIYAVKRGVNLV